MTRKYDRELTVLMYDAYNKGMSFGDVAKAFGTDVTRVRSILEEYEFINRLPTLKLAPSMQLDQTWSEWAEIQVSNGYTVKQIAKASQITYEAVMYRLKQTDSLRKRKKETLHQILNAVTAELEKLK